MADLCPFCGTPGEYVTSDEGTSYFQPAAQPAPAHIEWHCASCTGYSFDRDDPECHGVPLAAAQPAPDPLREAARAFVDIWGETEAMESSHAFRALRAAIEEADRG